MGFSALAARRTRAVSPEPLPDVITDPERVRHDGERRIHRAARGEEARVDDVEVVNVVGLAVYVEGRRLHGTGCVLSAAITAGLARGNDLAEAVAEAKRHVTRAIEAAPAGEY